MTTKRHLHCWCVIATAVCMILVATAMRVSVHEYGTGQRNSLERIRAEGREITARVSRTDRLAERDTIALMRDDIKMIRQILEGDRSRSNDCAAFTLRAVHAAACETVAVSDGEAGHRGR
ncbi:hypothetical protein [Phreatobacter sp. AB_2022a]|uniref:hypothetical protein n=1 Tax=Phreatobacter sp. AB_2022a TaxID=3003134 RepID=UPI0022874BC2|nr:hypothetical protein [Phreatobacter sp. AB_2022a]MCZ0734419.1 hypothetical protein [Phreatobacter sp. AB_2022a]